MNSFFVVYLHFSCNLLVFRGLQYECHLHEPTQNQHEPTCTYINLQTPTQTPAHCLQFVFLVTYFCDCHFVSP